MNFVGILVFIGKPNFILSWARKKFCCLWAKPFASLRTIFEEEKINTWLSSIVDLDVTAQIGAAGFWFTVFGNVHLSDFNQGWIIFYVGFSSHCSYAKQFYFVCVIWKNVSTCIVLSDAKSCVNNQGWGGTVETGAFGVCKCSEDTPLGSF